ncbi:MAG: PIN domain-containing protein [Bryobacterales bacterium]|nr:PIN domain-containing protein [Bryobacterales bacterium]
MNATVVVDTDVVSYLFKSHPTAFQYLPDLADRTPMISFMTLAELDRWALEARWGEARRKRLREYLERFVVLPYDRDLCAKWAEVTVAAQACGRRIDCVDAWIAATALLVGAPLITHNRNDYLGVPGLTLISHGQ